MLSSKDCLILANRDYKTCILTEQKFPDEYAVTAATYHIQQAIEKTLKGLILINGGQPEFTHNINKLIQHCNNLGIEITEELDDISETLTIWETSSRYDPFINFSQKKYDKAKNVFKELYNQLYEEIDAIVQYEDNDNPNCGMTL